MGPTMWDDLKLRFQRGNAIIRLIMANVIVHILLGVLFVLVFLITSDRTAFNLFMREWFWFPSEWIKIPFRFWTIFTYMFLHADIWHLFFNMLILYIFGRRLNDLLPNEQIFPIYFWGGIAGAISFTLGFNLIPAFNDMQSSAHILGASASVMAVVLATATLNPTGIFQIPLININVELRYIAALWVLSDFIVIAGANPGGALAHLGGAFTGWLFIYQLRKGNDWSIPVNRAIEFLQFDNLSSPFKRSKTKHKSKTKTKTKKKYRAKMKVHKGNQRSDYYGDEYGRSFMQKYKDMSREECLNTILDKIKRSGYDSLSEDEKVFLDRYK